MKQSDVEKGAILLNDLKRIDLELERINTLASRLSTEPSDVCVNIEIITKEQHEAELAGYRGNWVNIRDPRNPTTLHTHTKDSEMLEIFGIMIAWRKQKRKAIIQSLKDLGIEP
jgi:hypothetical protein